MKRLTCLVIIAASMSLGLSQPQPPPIPQPETKFFTGAQPTPFGEIARAIKTGAASIHKPLAAPSQVIVVPKRLSVWGNNQYGCCVTSESVFSLADYSTFIGTEQIFVTDATTIAWARAHGWLNGAWLLQVIEAMQKDGIKDEKGVLRKAGTPSVVKYSDEESLKSAIAQGPVSIAIDAGALPSGAGNKNGWYVFGGRGRHSTNHCVSLGSYGPTSELFKAFNLTPPANAPANGYFVFTWGTIGIVDHQWIMDTCTEAWVRNPTVTDLAPPPPPPPPPASIVVSAANVTGAAGVPVKISPTASGGTSPYIFLFDYGDSTQDAAGTHTYKTNGSYTVTVTAIDSKGSLGTGTCVAAIGTNPPPPPVGAGTITWTIGGVTSQYELMPIGTRQKLLDLIGPTP